MVPSSYPSADKNLIIDIVIGWQACGMPLGHKEPPNKLTRDLTGHNESCSLTDAYRFRLRSSRIPQIPPLALLNEVSALVFNTASAAANLLRRHFMILCGSLLKTLSLCCADKTTFPNTRGGFHIYPDRGIPIKYFVRRLNCK